LKMTPGSLVDHDSPLSQIFENSLITPQLILVTGLSGAGKTTWCAQLAKLASKQGLSVTGILSPGIFKGDRKIGIGVKVLHTNEHRQLAKLRDDEEARLATPRWTFDPEAIEWANEKIRDSPKGDLLIIDELGPLEFLRDEGWVAGLARIDAGEYRVACVVVRSSLLPKALQRWPHALVVSGTLNH